MAVNMEIDRGVQEYAPKALHPKPDAEWIKELPDREQIAARALLAARDDVSAEAPRLSIQEALDRLRYATPGARGGYAVEKLRVGQMPNVGDITALSICVKARVENEAREADAKTEGGCT